MRKAYVFLYSDGTGGRETVRAWANQESALIHWRYDMPHSFYLISEKTAAELAESFWNYNGKRGRFLIAEITDNRQGLLPKDTWYLLRSKARKPKDAQ